MADQVGFEPKSWLGFGVMTSDISRHTPEPAVRSFYSELSRSKTAAHPRPHLFEFFMVSIGHDSQQAGMPAWPMGIMNPVSKRAQPNGLLEQPRWET